MYEWSREDIEKYPVWRHKKTDSLYHVLGVAECSTNGNEGEMAVIYFSMTHQCLKYRRLREFLDGRFVPELPAVRKGV